jgi:hypothetical protein
MRGLDLHTDAIEELRVALASEGNRVASLLPYDPALVSTQTCDHSKSHMAGLLVASKCVEW